MDVKQTVLEFMQKHSISSRYDFRKIFKRYPIKGLTQDDAERMYHAIRAEWALEDSSKEYLRDQITCLQSELKEARKSQGYDDEVIRLFDNALARFSPVPSVKAPTVTKEVVDEELCLCLSDWHLGEEVNPEEIDGINEYNITVARKRIAALIDGVVSIITKMTGYRYKKLNIFCLGDMVSGLIHEELRGGTAEVDQVMIVGDELTRIIKVMLDYFEEIEVSGVVGNHGRLEKKPYNKQKYNNFDYLGYNFAAIRFENEPRVSFNIPKSIILVKQVNGFNFLLRHGDTKVPSSFGIPFYGIKRADTQIRQIYSHFKDVDIHYHLLGHFHTQNMIDGIGGKIIMCGSLKGTDEHGLSSMLSASNVKQLLFSVHKNFGITWSLDLHCLE